LLQDSLFRFLINLFLLGVSIFPLIHVIIIPKFPSHGINLSLQIFADSSLAGISTAGSI